VRAEIRDVGDQRSGVRRRVPRPILITNLLSPILFRTSGGEKPRRGTLDHRAFLRRISHTSSTSCRSIAKHPSSGFATFSPRKARGEKALDAGESLKKWEKWGLSAASTKAWNSRTSSTSCRSIARHPSSGFATFSPRKARGEKALDVKASLKKCEKCGLISDFLSLSSSRRDLL
jgi:hypothetical protein